MTNRQRFIRNGIMLTAVGLAVRSVSLLFNSYVSRTIGAEGMGLFTLITTVYSFAVTFASSGVSLTVTRLVSAALGRDDKREAGGVLRSALIYALVFSSFSMAVLLFGAEYFGLRVLGDARCVRSLRTLSFSLIPIALSSVFSGYFIGVKRVGKNAIVQVMAQVFKIAITVFFIGRYASLGVEAGTFALSLSITLTEIAVFLVALLQFLIDRYRHLPRSCGMSEAFPEVVKMAIPLALSAYIRSALLTLEHILIPKRLIKSGESHSEALASYGILHGMALPILLYPMSPLSSFAGLLVPEFSESLAQGDRRRMEKIAREAVNTTLVYSIAAAMLVFFFSEELGYAVYSSYDAGRYIALMAPVIPIMYLDHVADSILKGIGEQVYSMWVNITDSILSIILVYTLIPRLGIAGYGIVIIVMEGYNFTLSYLRLRKRIRVRFDPVGSIVFPMLSALVAVFISGRVFEKGGRFLPPVWLFLMLVFSVSVFIGAYTLLKLFRGALYKRGKRSGESLTQG